MKLSWHRKILLYSAILTATAVSLTAFATVHTASLLWEQEFERRNAAFSSFTSLEVLRAFGGRFSGTADPEVSEAIWNLTRGNEDLTGIMILTDSGRSLFSTYQGQDDEPGEGAWYEGLENAVRTVVDTSQPMARTFRTGSGRFLDVLAPAAGLGGVRPIAVRYVYGYRSLEEKKANLIQRVIIVAAILMVLVAGLSTYLSRGLTKPVAVLSSSAGRVAAGDRDHRIDLRTGDELEDFSAQFNLMLDSLADHRRNLEAANRELTEANRQMTELQAQLVRSERLAALGQLSAGVSHELDNPVGVILGYAELLMEETEAGDPLKEYAEVISAEAKRCKRIIAGLLDFSRPSRGEPRVVDLGTLITGLVDHLREQRPFRRIRWDLELGEGETAVRADPDSLRQVLVNLALNASQAMGEEGRITISLVNGSGTGGDGCVVLFSDSGPGVPMGDEERIFDPFYTTKRRGEGTGLGLSICRKLVEEAGGWIRAIPGPGGTFEVWLPPVQARTGDTASEVKQDE
ncbi:MAG: HAMP domain-containing protein [bacterium]|nr:MAG: HAMP domain-containing protein [bacterium]